MVLQTMSRRAACAGRGLCNWHRMAAVGVTVSVTLCVYFLSGPPAEREDGLTALPFFLAPAEPATGGHPQRGGLPSAADESGSRMTVRGGKIPGSGWHLDAAPPGTYASKHIHRVTLLSEACLPKIDGVTKTLFLVAQHNLNLGRDVLIVCPATSLYGFRENDPVLLPKRTEPLAAGQPEPSIRVVGTTSFAPPNLPYETRLGLPSLDALKAVSDFNPDVVQMFSPFVIAWLGVWFKRQRPEIALIANFQTDIVGMMAEYRYPAILEAAVWAVFRGVHNPADLTLSPSHFMTRRLRPVGINRLRLWIRGIDTRNFNPGKASNKTRRLLLNGRPESTLSAVYVGRVADEKHCELLIDVAKLDGVQLTIVGDGPARPALEALMAGTSAQFLGMVVGDELPSLYASADLFVFTGTAETAGNVVREAVASGTPVLLPNSGGVVDTVLDGLNGYLCEPEPRAFAEKVAMLRDNRVHLREMSVNAVRLTPLIPSWVKVMETLEHFYEEAYQRAKSVASGSAPREDRGLSG